MDFPRRLLNCLLLGLLLSPTCSAADAPRRPNIIFIMADDLGYGDLGCYGQTKIRTPHIDQLAKEGMRFTQFYAGSTVCAPSRCVLMTGLHTGHCYIRGNAKTNLRPSDVTVAEVLKQAESTTGLMGKWGLGHEGSDGVPTRQGFDRFFGYLDQTHAHNYYPTFLMRGEERVTLRNVVPTEGSAGQGVATQKLDYSHDLIAAEALTFIEENRQRRFFLYLAFTLPHANNEAGKQGMEIPTAGEYADKDWPAPQKAHAAMISRLDSDVGRILDRLRDLGLEENTLVCFTSDNGPHREGGADPEFFDSNGPLRGIKRDLYEGGIRVPFIAHWPGQIAASTVSTHVADFADVLPTLADVAGVQPPDRLDGVSLLPELRGDAEHQPTRDFHYWEFYEGKGAQAVRAGDWKLIVRPFGGEHSELYNLKTDLAEQHDVAQDHPDIVTRLRNLMQRAHEPSPLWTVRR